MKQLMSLLAGLIALGAQSQITLDHTYPGTIGWNLSLDKFQVSGLKYTEVDVPNLKINIYNVNHSLFKTMNIPSVPGTKYIYYISENLFDTDNLVEFAMMTSVTNTASVGPGSTVQKIYIFKENGTQMFFRDSASFGTGGLNNVFNMTDNVYSDGINTKMELTIQQSNFPGGPSKTEIYTLPGSIPCMQCSGSGGSTTGIQKNTNTTEIPVFYPNPVTDQLKLKYTLPKDTKQALIKITDIQGKLLEEFRVTDTFDYLYLPSNYNNGMYLYTLIVDGKTIKTEKIVLNK